jgi:hypothetical protein
MSCPFTRNEEKIKWRLKYAKHIRKIDILSCIIGEAGIFVQIYECERFEAELETKAHNTEDLTCTILRLFLTINSIILIILVFIRRKFSLRLKIAKNIIDDEITLLHKQELIPLIIEMLLWSVHSLPFVNGSFYSSEELHSIPITYDFLCGIIIFARVFLIWRVFAQFSYWHSERAVFICNQCHTFGGPAFSLKSELKERPYFLLTIGILISVVVFGFALRMSELPYRNYSKLDWNYSTNGMWCIIITMTTVGFGDFYPSTFAGRIIGVISCLWGTFLISLIVLALSNLLEFSHQEKKAYGALLDDQFKSMLENAYSCVITQLFRYRKTKSKIQQKRNEKRHSSNTLLQLSKLEVSSSNRSGIFGYSTEKKALMNLKKRIMAVKALKRKINIRSVERMNETVLARLENNLEREMHEILLQTKRIKLLNVMLDEIENVFEEIQHSLDEIDEISACMKEKLKFLQGKEKGFFRNFNPNPNTNNNTNYTFSQDDYSGFMSNNSNAPFNQNNFQSLLTKLVS